MSVVARTVLVASVMSAGFSGRAWAVDATFTQVAVEFSNNIGSINPNMPVALSDDGKVAFLAAFQVNNDLAPTRIWTVSGGTTSSIDLPTLNYSQVRSLQVNSSGNIAFTSNRFSAPTSYRGAYYTSIGSGTINTILEQPQSNGFPDEQGPLYNIDLTEGNKFAFSTIISSTGNLYRGTLGGSMEVLRKANGTFFNTKEVATNESGTVATQMEHTRPFGGLGRGILSFDTPSVGNEPAAQVAKTVIEQGSVALQPVPVMNNLGQVAFSLSSQHTMTFYTTPNDTLTPVLTTQTLEPGVYVGVPNAYGVPKNLTMIADNTGGFNTFGDVRINDNGVVVFEATLDGGGFGIFTGSDPVLDKVIAGGDLLNGRTVTALYLGELNNNDQFTMVTSDTQTDRRVWVVDVSAVPEPGSLALLGLGVAGVLTRRRRRGARG